MRSPVVTRNRTPVVILGAGFGGLAAAHARVRALVAVAVVMPTALGCTTVVSRPFDFDAQHAERAAVGCPDDVTDVDGNVYRTVRIGFQCWTASNLRTAHDQDGENVDDTAVIDLDKYGRLYRHAHVTNPRGLCPVGWHVPGDDDVKTLEKSIGLDDTALDQIGWRGATNPARPLKESDAAFSFTDDEALAVNQSGFSFLAAGEEIGAFKGADGIYGGMWTRTSFDDDTAWVRYFVWMPINPRTNMIWRDAVDKDRAYSVRCLMIPKETSEPASMPIAPE